MSFHSKILKSINFKRSRITFSTDPVILLCGGAFKEKSSFSDSEPLIESMRGALYRHSLRSCRTDIPEFFRPEDIISWQQDGIFKNLLELESGLASICSLLVIIVESEGSIAELGAFSQFDYLTNKLVVIAEENLSKENSFINLGVLRYIREKNERGVKVYPWNLKPFEISEGVINDILDDIILEVSGLQKTQFFDCLNDVHIMTFIHSVIDLFSALKEKEILSLIESIGRDDVSSRTLRGWLFLMERFRLLKKIEYSDASFFSVDNIFHKIKFFHEEEGKALDFVRTKFECTQFYKSTPKERNRLRAIEKYNPIRGLKSV